MSSFQKKLDALEVEHDKKSLEFMRLRQELFMSVQSLVLPLYGFEGTTRGVYKMMAAVGPYVNDREFVVLATKNNALLGVHSPPSTWAELARTMEAAVTSESTLPLPDVARPGVALSHLAKSTDGLELPKSLPVDFFIAGTWNDFTPEPMSWDGARFVHQLIIGPTGEESFQLMMGRSWDFTIYPSVADANPFVDYVLCGPDDDGHGKNWTIGRHLKDKATNKSLCNIFANFGPQRDGRRILSSVRWELMETTGFKYRS